YGSVQWIRRIGYESTSIIVEIDLTWSLGLVLVKLGRLPNPLSCSTLLICPIWISKVLIDAPWFLMAASVEAHISLIKLEFSSCLGMKDSCCSFDRMPELLLYIPLLEKVHQIVCGKLLLWVSLLP
ncbi:hypothetical protein Tco_1239654, partial [Tanacetum coccineum]